MTESSVVEEALVLKFRSAADFFIGRIDFDVMRSYVVSYVSTEPHSYKSSASGISLVRSRAS